MSENTIFRFIYSTVKPQLKVRKYFITAEELNCQDEESSILIIQFYKKLSTKTI